MKKILSYAVAAILLGTVTMLVPTMLFESYSYGQVTFGYEGNVPMPCPSEAYKRKAVPLDGGEWDEGEALGLTRSPLSNILPAGLLLIPSFLLALGVSLYLKKRMF
jgi:hypothetical protein